jgi:CCR4-NOT transcription complex subunit 1
MGPAQSDELSALAMSGVVSTIGADDSELSSMRDRFVSIFSDWVHLYQHPSSNEIAWRDFVGQASIRQHGVALIPVAHHDPVKQILQQNILQDSKLFSMFFRICVELSVEVYLKQVANSTASTSAPYRTIDACTKLMSLFVRLHDASSGVAQADYFKKILSIIMLVLVKEHEKRKQDFNQKPFFRLFTGLLHELNVFEILSSPEHSFAMLQAFSETFHTLRPSFLPGFTFSWISLISHRLFMPRLLQAEDRKVSSQLGDDNLTTNMLLLRVGQRH